MLAGCLCLVGLLASGCNAKPGEACQKSSDCAGGLYCTGEGKCAPVEALRQEQLQRLQELRTEAAKMRDQMEKLQIQLELDREDDKAVHHDKLDPELERAHRARDSKQPATPEQCKCPPKDPLCSCL